MPVNIVAPAVKASIVASTIDFTAHPACLVTTLTRVITDVAAIKVAGTINQGASSINSRMVLILAIPQVIFLSCHIWAYKGKKFQSF
jgi:hypothetical protein